MKREVPLPVYPALGDLLEMIHEILATANKNLQVEVVEDIRGYLTRVQKRL